MPNIARVLKEEIARISRKEAKAAVSPIRKPSVRYRKDIADLKRRMESLEKTNKELVARLAKIEDDRRNADRGHFLHARRQQAGSAYVHRPTGLDDGDAQE